MRLEYPTQTNELDLFRAFVEYIKQTDFAHDKWVIEIRDFSCSEIEIEVIVKSQLDGKLIDKIIDNVRWVMDRLLDSSLIKSYEQTGKHLSEYSDHSSLGFYFEVEYP